MMDYEVFKKEVEDKFAGYLPGGMELRFHRVDKVNVTLDAVSAIQEEGSISVAPTLYIEDMYGQYIKNGDLEWTFRRAASDMLQAMKARYSIFDKGAAKDSIVFQLINTGQNQGMLANIPSRPFLDLSIVYRWVVHMDDGGVDSAVVSDGMARHLGLTEGQLFKLAMENTRRLFPPVAMNLNDTFHEATQFFSEIAAETGTVNIPAKIEMWLLTNSRILNGAASLLFEEELFKLAGKIGSDLDILPSSLHEVIVLPTGAIPPDDLAGIVEAVNISDVEPSERLSNQVYHYDRKLRKLTLAADTQNKSLTGRQKKGGKYIWE